MNDLSWLKIKECKEIKTQDMNSEYNGRLIDILNRNDEMFSGRHEELFQQFYMTTVLKGRFKGLHIHPYKTDTIFVAHGRICLVLYPEPVSKDAVLKCKLDQSKYIFIEMGEGNYKTVSYPSIYPHGFWGIAEESVILNYRNPAWNKGDVYQYDMEDPDLLVTLKNYRN